MGTGFVVLVLLAGAVAVLSEGRSAAVQPEDVVVASAPGAHVPGPEPGAPLEEPVCEATPSTGEATVSYRVAPDEEWTKLEFRLCSPPTFLPGALSLAFRSDKGAFLYPSIPAGWWMPYQKWRGADAKISLVLPDGRQWSAWDSDLPCRIRTAVPLRRFLAPITSFYGEKTNGRVLVGGSVRAKFECSNLPRLDPPREDPGPPIDLRGELAARNCEATNRVVPPPDLPAGCPEVITTCADMPHPWSGAAAINYHASARTVTFVWEDGQLATLRDTDAGCDRQAGLQDELRSHREEYLTAEKNRCQELRYLVEAVKEERKAQGRSTSGRVPVSDAAAEKAYRTNPKTAWLAHSGKVPEQTPRMIDLDSSEQTLADCPE